MKLQRNAWLGIALGLVIAIGGLAGKAVADRPGTPNQLVLRDCGFDSNGWATICGEFHNTASEVVRIETDIKENGHTISPGVTMGCQSQQINNPAVTIIPCSLQPQNDSSDVQFLLSGAKFDSTYCFGLRTRRMSDQMVSEFWSAPVCLHTGSMPAFPTKPDIRLTYTGSIWSNGKQVPQQIQVAVPPLDSGTSATVAFGARPGFEDDRYPNRWVYLVGPSDTQMTVTLCKSNVAGKVCATQTVDIARQVVVSGDGMAAAPPKVVHMTGSGPGSKPVVQLTFTGTWHVVANYGQFDLQMVQLPNSSIRGFIDYQLPTAGSVLGGPTGASTAHLSFAQGARAGTVDVTLTATGGFQAIGKENDGAPVTWTATRKVAGPN